MPPAIGSKKQSGIQATHNFATAYAVLLRLDICDGSLHVSRWTFLRRLEIEFRISILAGACAAN